LNPSLTLKQTTENQTLKLDFNVGYDIKIICFESYQMLLYWNEHIFIINYTFDKTCDSDHSGISPYLYHHSVHKRKMYKLTDNMDKTWSEFNLSLNCEMKLSHKLDTNATCSKLIRKINGKEMCRTLIWIMARFSLNLPMQQSDVVN
jgi:hypothetical protein